MDKWRKGFGITLTTLILLISQATLVLARAGGGKGGSLGGSAGRSFSGGSFSGGTFSGGGFSGGFSGRSYTGGFFPFPFPFFIGGTGYSGGSIFGGLFGFLFIMVILYLVFKAMRASRKWRGGGYRGEGGFGRGGSHYGGFRENMVFPPFGRKQDTWQSPKSRENPNTWENRNTFSDPVDINGRPISNADNMRRFAQAISFTRDNMQYFAQTFPRWDRAYLNGRIRQVFFWFQDAWSRQDLSEGAEYLAMPLSEKYRADLEHMRTRGERNLIKEPMLNPDDIEFIDSTLSESGEKFVAMLSASLIDYTIDASGRTIAGDEEKRLYFTEFWEFIWEGNKWLLNRIYQEDALELAQITRR